MCVCVCLRVCGHGKRHVSFWKWCSQKSNHACYFMQHRSTLDVFYTCIGYSLRRESSSRKGFELRVRLLKVNTSENVIWLTINVSWWRLNHLLGGRVTLFDFNTFFSTNARSACHFYLLPPLPPLFILISSTTQKIEANAKYLNWKCSWRLFYLTSFLGRGGWGMEGGTYYSNLVLLSWI